MITWVNRILAGSCIMIMSFLVICVLWQVVARWSGISSTFTDELARFLFMWTGLMGAAYTLGKKRHLALDLMLQKARGKSKKRLQLVILSLSLTFLLIVMINGGATLVLDTLASKQISPVLGIPMGYVYLSIPVSGSFMVFYIICQFIEVIKGEEQNGMD